MTIIGSPINSSATISMIAGEVLTNANGKAVVVDDGKIKLAGAGANAFGIVLISEDAEIKEGERINVQIKDIGMWISGDEIDVGDELTPDSQGRAVKAVAGDFIVGIAVSAATQADVRINAQYTKSGYKA